MQKQNRCENDTVSASPVNIEGKGKDKPAELDSQKLWQKLAGQTIVAGDHLQENLLKSVSCRFCDADVTLLENVSARLRIALRGMCISLIISSLALSLFEVVLNFLIDICTRTTPKVFHSLVYANAFSLSLASLKPFR